MLGTYAAHLSALIRCHDHIWSWHLTIIIFCVLSYPPWFSSWIPPVASISFQSQLGCSRATASQCGSAHFRLLTCRCRSALARHCRRRARSRHQIFIFYPSSFCSNELWMYWEFNMNFTTALWLYGGHALWIYDLWLYKNDMCISMKISGQMECNMNVQWCIYMVEHVIYYGQSPW